METRNALGKLWHFKTPPSLATYDGTLVDLLEPDPATISDEAIAHGLSNECRFGNSTRVHYSVAQHSVNVAKWLLDQNAAMFVVRQGLFHDAPEFILKDVPTPLKQLLPDYKLIENNMQRVIFQSRALGWPLEDMVHYADRVMLETEVRAFLPPAPWVDKKHGYDPTIRPRHVNDWFSIPLSQSEAMMLWLDWEAFTRP